MTWGAAALCSARPEARGMTVTHVLAFTLGLTIAMAAAEKPTARERIEQVIAAYCRDCDPTGSRRRMSR